MELTRIISIIIVSYIVSICLCISVSWVEMFVHVIYGCESVARVVKFDKGYSG